ncbi:hypothetical protein L1987_17457 [Smallanthus sonchifolius]|uniref:Uncharacterized protein n=1 Tax=Smallanthus sonchifolius TaxID=185202 RepID=A0ACB9IXJ4_9ASTR|nr:hypothetical protein L1987_17457 [Smallanthus sonchifolius]
MMFLLDDQNDIEVDTATSATQDTVKHSSELQKKYSEVLFTYSFILVAYIFSCNSENDGFIRCFSLQNSPNDLQLLDGAPAHHLFILLGYKIHDIEAKYYADGEDAYDMRKQLKGKQHHHHHHHHHHYGGGCCIGDAKVE